MIFPNPFLNFVQYYGGRWLAKNIVIVRMVQQAGQRWREITQEQKLPFIEMAEEAKSIAGPSRKKGSRRQRRRDPEKKKRQ